MQRGFPATDELQARSSEAAGEGLAAVFLANRARLARFLRARCADDGVEDLLQELWLRIHSDQQGPVDEPLSYLFRAAHRLVLDQRRGASRRMQRETAWKDASEGDGSVEPASAERQLIARETLRSASQVLAALGPRADQVFRRFRLEGETQAAIAADLGVSLSTVEKDLQKAYAALLQHRRRADAE